jgi:hypothetical protein
MAPPVFKANDYVFGAFRHLLQQAGGEPGEQHPFMLAFGAFISTQQPFQLALPPDEVSFYDKIVRIYCAQSSVPAPRSSQSLHSLLRLWLGVGTVSRCLEAVAWLLSCPGQSVSQVLFLVFTKS